MAIGFSCESKHDGEPHRYGEYGTEDRSVPDEVLDMHSDSFVLGHGSTKVPEVSIMSPLDWIIDA